MKNMNQGTIVQVIGPVVDIKFTEELPDIYNAVLIRSQDQRSEESAGGLHITLEAMQHLGNDTVRCVALSSTDGLKRGMVA
ncbi:MAG TPA: F0F1 ATP synthase subunit beta, partial [Clostridia bacterium]|nr:F0F1 ATP synthase subunit beta [Clostridia bacterium]